MLDTLGTIAGSILGLPGILGFALGMMTRNLLIGCGLGGLVGIVSTFIFHHMSFAFVEPKEIFIAVAIGVIFGALGTLLRKHGATV